MKVSIFNDVVGPVMRGASSSHCAAALRIGRLARDLMGGQISSVLVEFDRSGSLPTTHDSQGSDMGLFGGLMGWEADDERLPDSARTIEDQGIQVRIEIIDVGDPHPSTYRLTLTNLTETHSLRAISTGGGMIEVLAIDEIPIEVRGDYFETLVWINEKCHDEFFDHATFATCKALEDVAVHRYESVMLVQLRARRRIEITEIEALIGSADILDLKWLDPVLPVLSSRDINLPYSNAAEMLDYDHGKETPLWQLAVQYEMARGGLDEQSVVDEMVKIVRILRRSIALGIAGTLYEDRILPPQTPRFKSKLDSGTLFDGGMLNRMILYVSSLMEVKSSMGVIVAAPTAGACAAFPASVIAACEELGLNEEDMAKAMLAGAVIGVFIATAWTFAAEVAGCQAEGGAAAGMAAAALSSLGGGSAKQCLGAASMALQNMLGLICDPVGRRVEVPCLGKNVMASSNALACANMSLAGFDQVIPLDEVIETAKRVSAQMPRELRCTGLGGLAITATSQAIERKLYGSSAIALRIL